MGSAWSPTCHRRAGRLGTSARRDEEPREDDMLFRSSSTTGQQAQGLERVSTWHRTDRTISRLRSVKGPGQLG
jgi:hypothetical protein